MIAARGYYEKEAFSDGVGDKFVNAPQLQAEHGARAS